MIKLKITQVRSSIGRPKDQKATLQALGLGRPNYFSIKVANPQLLGMIRKVSHLIRIEEITD
jgi:large subunit ribosomal protein L30